MPRLTEAEYDALEDEITRNPPDVDTAKALATRQTPEEVVHALAESALTQSA